MPSTLPQTPRPQCAAARRPRGGAGYAVAHKHRRRAYQGTGKGYASDIVLDVTIESGKIADVQVVTSNETAALGEAALPEYAAAIVETQDPAQIDVAAGASNTLKGFQEAINNALSQAAQ